MSKLDSIAAGFVGACALAVSAYTAYLQHQQVQAQVWPMVVMGLGIDDTGARVLVHNRGVGPAKIRTAEVKVDGKPVQRWVDLMGKLGQESVPISQSNLAPIILSGGSEKEVFKATDPRAIQAFVAGYKRLTFDLCYCSILNECWRAQTDFAPGVDDDDEPVSVRSCTKPAVPFDP